jgi:hypothetical protein
MKKRDFIQNACIQFMPELQWNIDKSIQYAEKLWLKLDEKGYGEPRQTGAHELTKGYDKLSPVMKAAFDLFWLAFDYKKGKDDAAAAWLHMGELPKADYDRIIAAAKREGAARKTLPEGQVAIMAQGWLNKRRWLDSQATATDQAKQRLTEQQQAIAKLNGDLNHAKRMAEQSGDQFWADETEKLTQQLRNLRDTKHDQQP